MLPPLPRCSSRASSSLISPRRVSLPRKGRRVGLHIDLFEDCSAFTRVAACTLALSPIRDTLIEGFSHFVTSMTAPIASGWSESPGGACTHWKAPPCHGAPPTRSLPRACRRDSVTRRRHRLIAFAPTAAAVRRRRPRIEVGNGDVVAGIIRDDLAPKAAVAPVGYSSSGVCSVPYGPDRVGTFAKRSPS